MAEYMVAEEKDLIALPDELSYADGAQVACGFGTVYEGLEKIGINGNHAVLITGLGPVGLATGALCRKLGANKIIGIDVVPKRMQIALDLGLCDAVLASGPNNVEEVKELTGRFRRGARGRLLGASRRPRHGDSRHSQMGKDRIHRRRRKRGDQSIA
jgi:threonine dehydrogenase-like Zn-dependent dehydrogenase